MDNRTQTTNIQTDTAASRASDGSSHRDSPPKPKSWWETKLEGRKLALMWFLTTILGMLFISFTSDTPRLLLPIGLLSIYAWYGYRYVSTAGELVTLRQARVGQLADSLYFLGFLWTLYALIDSFVIHPHQISLAEAGFRAFGYALVTTASGMFFRLFLLQFGYSEEEQVRLAKQNVEEEIARFAKELTKGTESISNFLVGISSLEQSVGTLKGSVDEANVQISDLTTRLTKLHSDSLIRLEEHAKKSITNLFEKLNFGNIKEQLHTELQQVITALRETISATTRSIEAGTAKFTDTTSIQIEKLRSSLQDVSKQIGQIEVQPDVVEKAVGKQVGQVTSTLVDASKAVEGAIRHLSGQIGSVRVPHDIVEKSLNEQLSGVVSKLTDEIGAFQNSITQLSDQIHNVRAPADLVEKTITQEVKTATANLTASVLALKEAINNLERSVKTVTNQVRAVRFKPWWKFWT